jgi:hypothetical protein|tara:strand:- start:1705 stop:1863 length:159 start_codon:yes stop_codon:yes gene_type:complete
MEIVTVSFIIGGAVLFFIGTQIIGLCCRGKDRLSNKKRRTFYGTSDTIYNGL